MHLLSPVHAAGYHIRALTHHGDRHYRHIKHINVTVFDDGALCLACRADTRQLLPSFSQQSILNFPRVRARKNLAHCQLSSQVPAPEVLDKTSNTIADIKEGLRSALTGDYVALLRVCPDLTSCIR